jgi:short-subunit dehydrogenase
VVEHGEDYGKPAAGTRMDMNATPTRHLALVTGASTGIGLELARQFADNGFDLVIVAHDDPLEAARQDLQGRGATVEAVRADLASPEGVEELWRRVQAIGRPLAAAALNAGRGAGGAFAGDTDLADELEIVDLNVRSTVHLAKYVATDMAARGEGRILFTSSIAATMPGSYQAVYNASKSFVQSFALALRKELEDTGVTVTSLMPGPTDTEFFDRADMLDTKLATGYRDDPADVARDGFEALMSGDERVVSASMKTKLQARASRVMPDKAKAAMHADMAEPGSAKE